MAISQYKATALRRPFVVVAVVAAAIGTERHIEATDGLAVVVRPPALDATFGAQMPVQRVHARKSLAATVACVRADIKVQGLVAFAIVLAREALFASGPLALERPFLVMRAEMAFQVEVSCKRAATAWNGTYEVGLRLAPAAACGCCRRSGNMWA